ncbi:MAG: FHIPEP family type III secretion protein [Spirochaetia bacterium]|nr:FHIPEP family type III secretion protein [Spirochaetia bacterium]MBQ3713879.1 FHIPEP family type III secretion protein [Spirochaetia bacterium]
MKSNSEKSKKDYFIAIGIIVVIAMMLIPLPTPLLDAFMALNLMGSLAIILIVLYSKKPSEFSIFPTLLLIATVFGLGLNISSTRLILLKGAAFDGRIIRAFSRFVVGGSGGESLVIGVIIFIILIAVQLVVITRGATRSAEVAARFTLDSMVQKNLSIDSQVQSGAISAEEGMRRRAALKQEVDFYSAMDGASKFVSGNVKVGILITLVNIFGGLIVGICFKNEPFGDAVRNYTTLTIGDGLVTQFPALLISTATAMIVTRSVASDSFAAEFSKQFAKEPGVFLISGFFALFLAIVPGFHKAWFVLVILAAVAFIAGLRMRRDMGNKKEESSPDSDGSEKGGQRTISMPAVQKVDPVSLELGAALIPLVSGKDDFLDRITGLRSQVAMELGFVAPKVRIKDNLQLGRSEYCIKIRDIEADRASVRMGRYLAVDFDGICPELDGEPVKEPVSGSRSYWISESEKESAQAKGYFISDVPSLIITHLTEVVKLNAPTLLGRQELSAMLEEVSKSAPAVVDEVKSLLSLGEIHKVIQNLLKEQVSVRDMVTVLEALCDAAPKSKDITFLTEKTRQALARQITAAQLSKDRQLHVITLSPELEQLIAGTKTLDRELEKKISSSALKMASEIRAKGFKPVLLCMEQSRPAVKRAVPQLCVMSVLELAEGVKNEFYGQVEIQDNN